MDLFVRVSNAVAIGMYEKFGYSTYRRVLGYYSGNNEDALGELTPLHVERVDTVLTPRWFEQT